MVDISVVIVSNRPKFLAIALEAFKSQSLDGLSTELIVVINDDQLAKYRNIRYPINFKQVRAERLFDNGMNNSCYCKDLGAETATGEYIAFWDDDNIYFDHCLATLYSTAYGHDVGIARTYHTEYVIGDTLDYGNIDSMCFCVKRSLALEAKWFDGNGYFSDFRFINRVKKLTSDIQFNKIIVGQHL